MENLMFSAKNTAITVIGCIIATALIFIQLMIFGSEKSELLMMNPLLSGYLHLSLTHFALNILILFVFLLPDINREYDAKRIFYITTIISLLYLPIEVLDITQIAIGISGTCYFLLTRSFLTLSNRTWLGACMVSIIAIFEVIGLLTPDKSANGVHLLGMILGIWSLVRSGIKILPQEKA